MRSLALATVIWMGITATHAQPTQAVEVTPAASAQQEDKVMFARTHTVDSRYSFQETITRLENAVQARGMKVFARIDHQAAAQESGLQMQPATVLVFGTPKAGTPLMVRDPAFALQLPLRVLVTEVGGKVQVVFNDTHALIEGSQIAYADVAHSLAKAEGLIRKVVSE